MAVLLSFLFVSSCILLSDSNISGTLNKLSARPAVGMFTIIDRKIYGVHKYKNSHSQLCGYQVRNNGLI